MQEDATSNACELLVLSMYCWLPLSNRTKSIVKMEVNHRMAVEWWDEGKECAIESADVVSWIYLWHATSQSH